MLLFNENAISSGLGYTIENSLRFRSSASAYLSRTFGTGDRKTWTWSGWAKRGALGSGYIFASAGPGGFGIGADIIFVDNTLRFIFDYNSGSRWQLVTTPVYRDPSSWYHFVVCADTTNATSTDRLRIYVNGVRVTNFSTANYPTLNADGTMNQAYAHNIGQQNGGGYFDGYMAEVNFIDGQALTPASFGEIDTSTNSWTAKEYTGTYGTNGFYLPFTDTTSTTTLVADSSGNGNNWTPNNISLTAGVTYDSMIDSPTNGISGTQPVGNYCTLNPLDRGTTYLPTLSNGNLNFVAQNNTQNPARATLGTTSGKWYFEATCVAKNYNPGVGVMGINSSLGTGDNFRSLWGTQAAAWYSFTGGGNSIVSNGSSSSYATSFVASDVIMVAYDVDTGKFWVGKNGTWNASGDPANGANNAATFAHTDPIVPFLDGTLVSSPGDSWAINFGQRPFSYTPPTGFKSLNTANLPEPTIKNSSKYMDVTTWTGTGATRSITGVGFQPDLVWTKSRSNAETHKLVDSVRGATKALSSETTGDEVTESGITSFNTDGFTIDGATDTGYNTNTYTYVGWQWKEGTAPGFDIVTYTGNGTARTISHSLGVAPNFMIVKARTTASTDQGWPVYHKNNTAAPETDYLLLNSTAATADLNTIWNDTAPTSSVFSVGTNALVNTNNDTYVAYLFAEVPGFSKFGSYTGNGSTDGPFVFCGFRPRFVMIKKVSDTGSWELLDTSRSLYNDTRASLLANSSAAETDGAGGNWGFDILSNGFKIRGINSEINTSGGTYIFAAFAETPFKYSLAR